MNLPLSVNMRMCCALQWTDIPYRVYSCLTPGVAGIDSRQTTNLNSVKVLTEDEGILLIMISIVESWN